MWSPMRRWCTVGRERGPLLCGAMLLLCLPLVHAFSQSALPPFQSRNKQSTCVALRMAKDMEGQSAAARLRKLLEQPKIHIMPCCFDALSARLIQRAGFELTFMSGFSTSAAKIGLPDTGYISYGEMLDAGRDIAAAVSIPVLADGDTGYGNAMNVKRTVRGYAQTGLASVMIEDQVAPKRCGHTKGKQVVGRAEAVQRIEAAVDARDEGADILILARTDARTCLGLDEALERVRLFEKAGADIVFLEAPESEVEMRLHCEAAPNTPKLANMLEGGKTPVLPPAQLHAMGYQIAAYPLTLLSRSIRAMEEALQELKEEKPVRGLLDFPTMREIVGFNEYYAEEERYRIDDKRE